MGRSALQPSQSLAIFHRLSAVSPMSSSSCHIQVCRERPRDLVSSMGFRCQVYSLSMYQRLTSRQEQSNAWNIMSYSTRSSAIAEIARDAVIQGHSRSSVVVSIDAVYYNDSLLALNSNLTSIFNRSWDITPIVCTSMPTSLPGGTQWRSDTSCVRCVRTPLSAKYITIFVCDFSECMYVCMRIYA